MALSKPMEAFISIIKSSGDTSVIGCPTWRWYRLRLIEISSASAVSRARGRSLSRCVPQPRPQVKTAHVGMPATCRRRTVLHRRHTPSRPAGCNPSAGAAKRPDPSPRFPGIFAERSIGGEQASRSRGREAKISGIVTAPWCPRFCAPSQRPRAAAPRSLDRELPGERSAASRNFGSGIRGISRSARRCFIPPSRFRIGRTLRLRAVMACAVTWAARQALGVLCIGGSHPVTRRS